MLQAPAPSSFASPTSAARSARWRHGLEEVRVTIRLDGSLEVTVRRNALDDLPGEELD
jgi:hypothetical protein